jgi:hypothetical protein
MTEGFPAHYQQLLERYYRRLAEEKPASEGVDEAAPLPGATAKPPAEAMKKPPSPAPAKLSAE